MAMNEPRLQEHGSCCRTPGCREAKPDGREEEELTLRVTLAWPPIQMALLSR